MPQFLSLKTILSNANQRAMRGYEKEFFQNPFG